MSLRPDNILAILQLNVETVRVAGLRRRYDKLEGLDDTTAAHFTAHTTSNTPRNRAYKGGQQLLYQWAISDDIDISNFSCTDLINVLTVTCSKNYSLSTIKLFKVAILKFHYHPS